jgi:hypothetical protein
MAHEFELPELKAASDALDALIRKLSTGQAIPQEEVDQGNLLVKACDSRRGNVNMAFKVKLARPQLARIIDGGEEKKPAQIERKES